MEDKILKIVYTFFLGIMLALFVGLGINTFYPGPKAPEYPVSITEKQTPTEADTAAQRRFETQMQDYSKKEQAYSRNVSIIALVAAIVLLAGSLALERLPNKVLVNGVLLGGLFTLLYSVIRGFASEDSKMTFIAVSIGLAIAIYLGYHRFSLRAEARRVKEK